MSPHILGSALIAEAASAPASPSQGKSTDRQPPIPPSQSDHSKKRYKWDIVWQNVVIMAYLHVGAVYGLYLGFAAGTLKTFFWCFYLIVIGSLGTTAGAHRLWTHNTYKAKLPLRILLAYFQATCFQNHIYDWVRDHRMHHKYTDTDADPHNATRGFFFSHVGWLLVRKHKDVLEKGKTIYLKDIEADPVVVLQKKYFAILMPICCFVLPAVVPWYFWGETLHVAWYTASVARYIINLNGTWLVNSAAHIYGTRPYDKNILPRENVFVGYLAFGEGWHNYHHVFPWDYKTSELKGYAANLTTGFIDLCAALGLAYDLKSVSEDMIMKRVARTGESVNGTVVREKMSYEHSVWGWGDVDMSEKDIVDVITFNALQEKKST